MFSDKYKQIVVSLLERGWVDESQAHRLLDNDSDGIYAAINRSALVGSLILLVVLVIIILVMVFAY